MPPRPIHTGAQDNSPEEYESLKERVRVTGGVQEAILVNRCRCGRGGYDIINGV